MGLTIFAERMKATREEKGLKQNELAKMVGVTPTTISAYEKSDTEGNGKKPTLENAQAIAKALGCSLDWLCGIEKYKDDFNTYSNEQFYRSLAYVLSSTDVVMQEDCIKLFGETIDFARQANELYHAKLEKRLNDKMLNLCISCLIEAYQKLS